MAFWDGDSAQIKGPLSEAGRLASSPFVREREATFAYSKNPTTWVESTASGGSVTHDTNLSAVTLACTTTTNSEAVFQSRRATPMVSGITAEIFICCNLLATATSVKKRVGIFDTNNGAFFELDGSTLKIVTRSKTSGSVVDTAVSQTSWNIDRLDGTGEMLQTIDITKQQTFIISLQPSGATRFGFLLDGRKTFCHEVYSQNSLVNPWCQNLSLPLRLEIKNSASTAASLRVNQVAVFTDDDFSTLGVCRSLDLGSSSRSIPSTNTYPVLSLRKSSSYLDAWVKVLDALFAADSTDDFYLKIVVNGTLTGASWSAVTNSVLERDIAATAISGGVTVASKYLRGGGSWVPTNIPLSEYLGCSLTPASDILSLVVTNITSSTSIFTAVTVREWPHG